MRRPMPMPLTLCVLLTLATTGCAHGEHPATIDVTLGAGDKAKAFTLEVAVTETEIERGLMERDTLAANGGMIFVFSDMRRRRFWMKNCRIALDIVFFDAAGRIVSIHTLPPPKDDEENADPPACWSDGPARFAIELNAGEADKLGLRVGDKPPLPLDAIKRMAE